MHKKINASALPNKKFEYYEFDEKFTAAFGKPEKNGIWLIWGSSGQGKTAFTLELMKQLTPYGNVLHNSLEEGISGTMQAVYQRAQMARYKKVDLTTYTIDELITELQKQRSAKIAIIDSVQVHKISPKNMEILKKIATTKQLIFVSRAEGNNPAGKLASDLLFDANLKIFVQGFVAHSRGRTFGNTGKYIIWEDGATQAGNI